jgi:hypothetical protein
MPPHCDSMDGPVVTAARRALDQGDIAIVLPYVPAQAEPEVTGAFQQVLPMHEAGGSADELVRGSTSRRCWACRCGRTSGRDAAEAPTADMTLASRWDGHHGRRARRPIGAKGSGQRRWWSTAMPAGLAGSR